MPGPMLAVTIAESPNRGKWTGPIIVGGHAIAELAVIIILTMGLAALAGNKTVNSAIGIVGGAMLIIMGFSMLYDLYRSKIKVEGAEQKMKSDKRLVLDGILTSLSNPYWYVWWATTGAALLVKSMKSGAVGPPVFYIGHILSDLVWYTIVSVLIWKGRKLIVGTGYKVLITICALFLLYLGSTFIYDGWTGRI